MLKVKTRKTQRKDYSSSFIYFCCQCFLYRNSNENNKKAVLPQRNRTMPQLMVL